MFFQRVKTPGLGHNAYVVGCGEGLAVVVDPRRDVDEYLQLARDNNLSIAYVLLSHRQEDFEHGCGTLARLTGAKIVTGTHELFGDSGVKLKDGEELKVGTSRLRCLHTPGHTPESVTYAVYMRDSGDKCWAVFTGDTLFVGDTGRTDLTDASKTAENAGILYDSVHKKIAPLGDQALLYPAHGSGSACGGNISDRDESTLGIERQTNSAFVKSREDFIKHKVSEKMARPPYFKRMEEVNLHAGRPVGRAPGHVPLLQPKVLQARMESGVVLDTRQPDAFAGAHIPGSYNIWLQGVPAFAGWVASEGTSIFLVVDQSRDIEVAAESLARIGLDKVEGVLAGGIGSWREQGLVIRTLGTTSAAEAAERQKAGQAKILDVRDEYEWQNEHIPDAMHQYVGDLEKHLPAVPKDTEVVVHCSVGHRAGLAASILARNGYTRVFNMLGGLSAWKKLGLPLTASS
jgi:hydroxyacylglutathione hydrolase